MITPVNGLLQDNLGSWYQKGKTSLDLNEATDGGFQDGSGISWTTCKQSAPHSRQTNTPTPHHSGFFYRPDALPAAQPTVSKHRGNSTEGSNSRDG